MSATSENENRLIAAATPIFKLLTEGGSRRMNPERTESFISKIEQQVDKTTEELAHADVNVGAAFRSLIEEALSSEASEAKADEDPLMKSAAKLSVYLSGIERRWPMTIYSAMRGAGFETRAHFKMLLDCLGYYQQFSSKSKEPLSHLLSYATISVVELYYSAIEFVYQVECMNRGVIMRDKRGGDQLRRVSGWLKNILPEFIDDDANHFRNAAAHRHWSYDLASHSVKIRDQKWERHMNVEELRQRIESILGNSIAVTQALAPSLRVFLLELRECGVFDTIATGDGSFLDQRQLDIRFEPTIARLNGLEWSPRAD